MMHKKNTPFVFSDTGVFEDQGGGVKRKILAYGDALMQVEVHFEKPTSFILKLVGFFIGKYL